eukprot:EG_transcript_4319
MEARGYTHLVGKDGRPQLLGRGSFGKVYLVARDGGAYALKELRLDEKSEKQRRRARHEVKVLESLEHPNILQLCEFWEQSNVVTLVMEYASDHTLRDSIAKQKEAHAITGCSFLEVHLLTWAVQIGLALEYMHSVGALHRDLKTENVFVTTDNVIKLGDFGISAVLCYAKDAAVSFRGPPHSMAPELFANAPYSTKTDMWAFGCLLFELAALRRPFESDDLQAVIRHILMADVPPLPEQYTTDLQDLLHLLLQRNPEDRPEANALLHLPIFKRHLKGFKRRLQDLCVMNPGAAKRPSPPPLPASPISPTGLGSIPMSQSIRVNTGRRGSRLMVEPERRASIEKAEGLLDVEADPSLAMLSPKVKINFGSDRQRMKQFLQGPPPEESDLGGDADKLHAFFECSLPQLVGPSGRRRSDFQLPYLGQAVFSEVRYSRERTPDEHRSILGHLVRVYSLPAQPPGTYDKQESDSSEVPPEEMEGREAEGGPTAGQPPPSGPPGAGPVEEGQGCAAAPGAGDPAGLEPEGRDAVPEGLSDDATDGHAYDTSWDSDVRCASPRSGPHEVDDEALEADMDLDGDMVEVEEEVLGECDFLPSPSGSGCRLRLGGAVGGVVRAVSPIRSPLQVKVS